MKILPKNSEEAMKLVYDILNQGDGRYNDPKNEIILSNFLIKKAISLEEKDIPILKEPTEDVLKTIRGVQKLDKYIAKNLLNLNGFKDNEIFFERRFLGFRPDVFAESKDRIILVECCSCGISKVVEYLLKADEVWVLTLGQPPWGEITYLKEKMQWFIFKKGINWEEVLDYQKKQIQELKNIPSLL